MTLIKNLYNNTLPFDPIKPYKRSPVTIISKINQMHRKPESMIDILMNVNTEPAVGALIYCQLFTAEHSGIYLGNGRIAQLNGKGNIEVVSPSGFTNNITTWDHDIFIPVDSDGDPISNYIASQNAEQMIEKKRNYNVLLDNCHQFSAGCITGEFDNANNFLWMTKDVFKNQTSSVVNWQRWKWYK